MPITYKGPPPGTDSAGEGSGPVMLGTSGPISERARVNPIGLLAAVIGAAGLTACITLLYNGMAVIMVTEGGFVAVGGPYEIAHPAPNWVWLIPLSIMGLFLFGGINLATSMRGWGLPLTLFAWSGLFVSLGWNFLRYGFNPPEGMQDAWGWILCGVVFWVMGFWPLLMVFRAFRQGYEELIARQASDARRVWRMPRRADTTGVYLAAQVIGAALGIWAGIELFGVVTGL